MLPECESDITRTAKLLHEDGILEVGAFKELLMPREFQTILECLSSGTESRNPAPCIQDETEDRPRKCRRLGGVSSLLSSLKACKHPIWKLHLVGNQAALLSEKSEETIRLLSLIPSTIRELDLSNCSLSNKAIINLCHFMEANKKITRLMLHGNPGLNENKDQGVGRAISRMLGKNRSLWHLSIVPERGQLGVSTTVEIAFSLGKNQSLRVLHMAWDDDMEDQSFRQETKSSALSFGLQTNNSLREVTFGGLPPDDAKGTFRWEEVLQNNESISSICGIGLKHLLTEKMHHFLGLNSLNARSLMRSHDESDFSVRWLDTLIQGAQDDNITGVHALYYMLRQDPGFWC